MSIADYWLMGREYSICNATIVLLQFWTADLDPVTLGRATEEVYTTFLYSSSSHTLHQQPDKILFGCFVITLNAAFDQQQALEDEGYESSSDTINLPTPLRKMQESTMFPALDMLHSIPMQSHHETHQYADDCCSVYQLTTAPRETPHLLLEQLQQVLRNT